MKSVWTLSKGSQLPTAFVNSGIIPLQQPLSPFGISHPPLSTLPLWSLASPLLYMGRYGGKVIKNGKKLTFPIQIRQYLTPTHSKSYTSRVLSYEQTSIASPFPTHLGRLITRCPKGIHTAVVFSRACDTRAHPWTFTLFAFTTFTEKRKIRTIFNPKLKTKTAQKISYTSTKTSEILTKTSEILTKTWEFFEKTWEIFSKMSDVFLETLGNPPNSTKTLRPLSHKNRGKESHLPKTSLLPSTFSIASSENPSVILPQNPPFQPSISPFQLEFS